MADQLSTTVNCAQLSCGCWGQCWGNCRQGLYVYQYPSPPPRPMKLQTADTLDAFAADTKCPEKMRKKLADAASALRESHANDLLDQAKRFLKA